MTSFPKDQSLSDCHLAHEKKAMSPLSFAGKQCYCYSVM